MSLNNEDLGFLSTTYDVNQSDVERAATALGDEPEAFKILRRRLEDVDIDDFRNPRPDSFRDGWNQATTKVKENDEALETNPDLGLADLMESAEKLILKLHAFKRRMFLKSGGIDDQLRVLIRETWGQFEAFGSAIDLSVVDNDLTSHELAEALRNNDSVQAMRAFITDLKRLIEADRRYVAINGGVS